jgi:hypothetical protein
VELNGPKLPRDGEGARSNAAPYTFYVAALCNVYSALLPLAVRPRAFKRP